MTTEARYLLRFDDLCPTMSRGGWERFSALIVKHKLKPILGIVPANHDPDLMIDAPYSGFWREMRELADAGACFGLHGFSHVNDQCGRSLLPLHARTEFAGASENEQLGKIEQGLQILRLNGLDAKIWVAPRHGFDQNTLCALKAAGLDLLSDGLAARPFLRDGVVWLPQQLWEPVDKSHGLWTICIHTNTYSDAQFNALEAFVNERREQFTSVDEALDRFSCKPLRIDEAIVAFARLARIRLSKGRKRLQAKAHALLRGRGFSANS